VTVKPDAVFERDGYDVYVRVPITYSQAVLGAEIEVPTVDGKVAQKIPEGTQSGTKFRLRGQGHPVPERRGRGDQYVIVDVEIPKKLNRTQREALKAFEDSFEGRELREAQELLQEPQGSVHVLKFLNSPAPRNVENIAGAGFCFFMLTETATAGSPLAADRQPPAPRAARRGRRPRRPVPASAQQKPSGQ